MTNVKGMKIRKRNGISCILHSLLDVEIMYLRPNIRMISAKENVVVVKGIAK